MALLGKKFIDMGLIDEPQLQVALREQDRTGELLGTILYRLGFISEDVLATTLAAEAGVRHVNLAEIDVPPQVLSMIPEDFARANRLIPVKLEDDILTVAMVNTFNVVAADEIRQMTGCEVNVVSATEADINSSLDEYYGFSGSLEDIIHESVEAADETYKKLNPSAGDEDSSDLDMASQPPLVQLVDRIIVQAINERATDIHVEPAENLIRIRYRVDGILQQGPSPPKKLQSAIISRIKIMSGMNISEHRVPQDGRVDFRFGDRSVDLRVSAYPTVFGENMVMRILDKHNLVLGLGQLGFADDILAQFTEMIEKSHGIILVTGPTGSGKTTTLYSALTLMNTLEKHVITIEDPVEYQLPVIRQSQINIKAGFDFGTALRSILRQDPDVILVGEMRDLDTVETTIRAALTGHLVLSTLHTNDAAGALPRLNDMGAEPFLIASSVLGILAQRLVRIICNECKEEYKPLPSELQQLGLDPDQNIVLYQGRGCPRCRHTGYKGRLGIFELLNITPRIREMIMDKCSGADIKATAQEEGIVTMYEDGLQKALGGVTTVSEVLRVCTR